MLRWSSIVVLLAACGADGDARCVLGKSVACACASGESGAQVCGANGSFGACVCGRPDRDGFMPDGQVSETVVDSATVTPTDVATELGPDVADPCRAVITCLEGDEVAPQTTLRCSAASSSGAVAYAWSLTQPDGSHEVIRPSATQRDIQLTASVVGTYTLSLTLNDGSGATCEPVSYTIMVTSGEGVLVELTWKTPGDINESDSGEGLGSDLDLHVLHPDATGWFDPEHDAHWGNPKPPWTPADGDGLGVEDDDGAGPESFRLGQPETGSVYTVGVHYYDDGEYGPALATLRVFVYGQLRFTWNDVRMVEHDMWAASEIAWPSGDVTAIGGNTPHIEPDVFAPVAEP